MSDLSPASSFEKQRGLSLSMERRPPRLARLIHILHQDAQGFQKGGMAALGLAHVMAVRAGQGRRFSRRGRLPQAGAEEAAKPPAKVKEKKPSLFFRPEGEEAKPTAKKRGYANIMGAYSTGVSMSPGGAGAGARVLSVAGWKTALRAHRLLNARSGGGGGMRQITTQMGPRIRTGSMR